MSETAELKFGGASYVLPVVEGTENEKAIDIANLRSQSGLITLDSGYKNTGATTSSITYLDGEEGILRYRGYPIEQLAEKSNFLEVAHLLIYGELPTKDTLHQFSSSINEHSMLHENMRGFFSSFPLHTAAKTR
jgi:citrate synthase